MAKPPELDRPTTGNQALEAVLDRLVEFLRPVVNCDLVDGIIIEDVSINTTADVEHGLDRVPQGWLVIDKDANQGVWRRSESTSTLLYLQSAGAVTVDLWVF